MVLEYKFEYLSNNSTLVDFLEKILAKKETCYKILREDNLVFLYIDDEEDRLLEISNELSLELPMSIFIKNFTLEVVPQVPNKDYTNISDDFTLPYCSNCVANIQNKESTNFYNPFFICNICGTSCDVNTLKFQDLNEELVYNSYKELFEGVAAKIALGKKVKIKTRKGEFVFSKLLKLENEGEKLLCTNIENISNIAVGSKEKAVALLSIEKPSMDFNVNTIYQSHNNVEVDKVTIFYSYDLILYLLSLELSTLDINFLVCEDKANFDYELTYEEQLEEISTPKIAINEGKTLVIENENYDKNLDILYDKFEDKTKSQFLVLVKENKLSKKTILNVFSSTNRNDNISLFSEKIDGMIDILNYNIPNSIESIFDEISLDETGKRLIENYKNKYPEVYENAINTDISIFKERSIYTLWKIASIILGMENKTNSDNIIFKNASASFLQKGPRIDYRLNESDKIFNREFNVLKLIQSGISFKLAGVDDKTLSLGYVESFSYFLANLADEVNSQFPLEGISLCGNMIENELFYKLVNKAITKNFKLFYNKDFPIQL